MEVASPSTQTEPQTASAAARSSLGADLDSFLRLLTAQISNQDPLEPMDSTTFISQLAQLSQVEQSITSNENLEHISEQLTGLTELADVQLIGRDVTLVSTKLDLKDGQATIQYELSENANQVSIKIMGLDGNVIREINGLPKEAGTKHSIIWDGFNTGGLQVADGAYAFEIVASDSESNTVPYLSYVFTHVEELGFKNGQPTLLLRNDQEVSSGVISAVR